MNDLASAAAYTTDLSEKESFWADGYFIVRNAFLKEEMGIIRNVIETSTVLQSRYRQLAEKPADNAFETIFVWNDTAGDDVFSMLTRSNKILDRLAFFFDDDVYDYHNKVPLKYPGMRGFPFHQDYSYWYDMGNLYPDMATAFIAVDDAEESNGCLRFIKGSHRLGRIDVQGFEGIEPERLDQILTRFEEVSINLNSGDIVIFHCNILHGSHANNSDKSRLGVIGTYNTKHNSPYKSGSGHPDYAFQSRFYRRIEESDAERLPNFGV